MGKEGQGDPSDSTQLVVLDGYIGDSTHPDHVRIYLDSRLNRYIDVPEAAVRHQADIAGSTPAGAQRIWLDPDADIKTAPQTMSARFLEGNVTQTYAARAQTRQAARIHGQAAPGEPVPWQTNNRLNCPPDLSLIAETSICCPHTIPEAICTAVDLFCVIDETTANQSVCCSKNPLDCLSQLAQTCDPNAICVSEFSPDCTIGMRCPIASDFTDCRCPETFIDPWCGGRPPDTILQTDPIQLNRLAQLQRLRRAIGRRGLSRF